MNKPRNVGCKVQGCDEPHRALGYCYVHYQRVHRTGSPHLAGRIGRPAPKPKPKTAPRKRGVEDAIKVREAIVGTITLEQWKRMRAAEQQTGGVHHVRHQPGSNLSLGGLGGDVA